MFTEFRKFHIFKIIINLCCFNKKFKNRDFIKIFGGNIVLKGDKSLLKKKNKKIIYCISHDYSFIDILITFSLLKNNLHYNCPVSISKFFKKCLTYLLYKTNGDDTLNLLSIKKSKFKENKQCAFDTLKVAENSIIYLHKHSKRNGIYYLCKNQDIDLIGINIKSKDCKKFDLETHGIFTKNTFVNYFKRVSIIRNMLKSNYIVKINKINYDSKMNPEIFIENCKNNIYN